jgi:hypothetical protein
MNPDELLEIALDLVAKGMGQGVTLRLLGSLAIRAHTQGTGKLIDLLQRVPTHDIDFMGYSKEHVNADRMFKDLGYEPDPSVAFSQEYGIQRLIYHDRTQGIMAEIFQDKLRMAHTLDFLGRLELDSPTISLVDLLLSKLQIQQITEKDIKDMIALLAEHGLGNGDRELLDVNYLLKLTSDDWRLYYTAKNNLSIVREWVDHMQVLDIPVRQDVDAKLEQIINRVEAEPKSRRWKLRAKIGTRMRWYEEVGDVRHSY